PSASLYSRRAEGGQIPSGVMPVEQFLEVLRQYGFLFTIIGGIVAALGVAFAIYKASHDKQVGSLNDRIPGLEGELQTAKDAGDPVILKEQNSRLLQENGRLQNRLGTTDADLKTLQGQCDKLRVEVASVASTLQAEQEAARQTIDGLSGE